MLTREQRKQVTLVDSRKDNRNACALWNYIFTGTRRQNGQSVISDKGSQIRAEVDLDTNPAYFVDILVKRMEKGTREAILAYVIRKRRQKLKETDREWTIG